MILLNLLDNSEEKRRKHAAYMRKWYATRRGYSTKYVQRWRARHPETNRLSHAAYRNRPEKKAMKVAAQKSRRAKDPDKDRFKYIKHEYGLSKEQYMAMLESQGHKCPCCGDPHGDKHHKRLAVDHCHVTGKVRGLLCYRCNMSLGSTRERIDVLENLIIYLKTHA